MAKSWFRWAQAARDTGETRRLRTPACRPPRPAFSIGRPSRSVTHGALQTRLAQLSDRTFPRILGIGSGFPYQSRSVFTHSRPLRRHAAKQFSSEVTPSP